MTLFGRTLTLNIVDDDGAGVNLGGLKTTFDIKRAARGSRGTSKITVWNLSETTLARLDGQYKRIQLDAGYSSRSGIIFDGLVANFFTRKEGADKVTDIFAADSARDYAEARVRLRLAAGTTLHDALREIVASFGDAKLGTLAKLTDRVLLGPLTLLEPTRDALDTLAESYGFRWVIHDGVVEIFDKLGDIGGGEIEISRQTGMVGTPRASFSGVEAVTLLHPLIRPGGLVRIITAGARLAVGDAAVSFNPVDVATVSGGLFGVRSVRHIGDSRGQAWYTLVSTNPGVTT